MRQSQDQRQDQYGWSRPIMRQSQDQRQDQYGWSRPIMRQSQNQYALETVRYEAESGSVCAGASPL
jgi:hypothetical protein